MTAIPSVPGLFLGGLEAVVPPHSWTAVLTLLRASDHVMPGHHAAHWSWALDDNDAGRHTALPGVLLATRPILDTVLRVPGARVLVHCHHGVSRGPSIVLDYLLHRNLGTDYDLALALLRQSHPHAAPHAGFEAQLRTLWARK